MAAVPKQTDRIKTVERWGKLLAAVRDPYDFAVTVLGYDRLTRELHAPIMELAVDRFLRRPLVYAAIKEQVGSGLLPRDLLLECEKRKRVGREYVKNTGLCIPRDHYKTTMMIALCALYILVWPEITIAHWHAVEDKAVECSDELGDHFRRNKAMRELRPEIMPHANNKKFTTAKGFTVKRREEIGGVFQKKERHPTFFPKGASAEVTGGHAVMGWLDDIVGQSTIDDSAMPKVRNWLGHTVAHVIRTDGGWLDATYTPWDEDDVMVDWEKDKTNWDVTQRACMETDGERDYNGTPILYDIKWIRKKKNDPGTNFPYQMMCDRIPDSERRWPNDWDGWCERDWALEGPGTIFVLSDPAPMGLSMRGEKDRVRGTVGKDWWSIAVVRLRVRGDFQDIILLDGAHSQTWTHSEGYDEACRLMKKWGTNKFFDEDYSAQLFTHFYQAAKRNGVQAYYEKDGKTGLRLPKYKESYVTNAKKVRFQKLCDHASIGGVWVSKSASEEFVYGDRDSTGAYTQASKWIPRKGGESNLKWDDDLDSWARSTDSALQKFAPDPSSVKRTKLPASDPFNRAARLRQERGPSLTRYI